MSRLSTVVMPLVCVVIVSSVLSAGEASVALRPKIGGLYAFSGDIGDIFDDTAMLQAEAGIKGTFGHFGLEIGLATIRGEDGTVSFTDMVEDDGDGEVPTMSAVNRSVGVDAQINGFKVTGTYELNPLAGVTGHESEGNVYFGGGAGYYPTKLKAKADIGGFGLSEGTAHYHGYGVHVVVGGEYFFTKVFGVFAEVQYAFLNMDSRDDGDDLDMHGISGMAGFTLKF